MKGDIYYQHYLSYLYYILERGKITKNEYCLFKISGESFKKFKIRFHNDISFNENINQIHKSILRNQKIDVIIGSDEDINI